MVWVVKVKWVISMEVMARTVGMNQEIAGLTGGPAKAQMEKVVGPTINPAKALAKVDPAMIPAACQAQPKEAKHQVVNRVLVTAAVTCKIHYAESFVLKSVLK